MTPVAPAALVDPDRPPPLSCGVIAPEEEALLTAILERRLPVTAARDAAEGLIARFHGLAGVLAADAVLLRGEGLDQAGIAELQLVRGLTASLARARACERPVLSSWSDLTGYLRVALAHAPREQFRVLYLDKRNILMREEHRADGTVDHAPVYPREVVRRALELSASALILVHNHPSGDPTPSRADIEMTRKIIDAAKVFDIVVHDHVVVGREGTRSFRALGLM